MYFFSANSSSPLRCTVHLGTDIYVNSNQTSHSNQRVIFTLVMLPIYIYEKLFDDIILKTKNKISNVPSRYNNINKCYNNNIYNKCDFKRISTS